jgi:anaerobic magnesium-protoporphyrin IX monomethyl ester cyclase
MRVALVFPPLADATQPYSSLPALAGFLRDRGRHEVVLHDANVHFVRLALTSEHLQAAASGIEARLDDDDQWINAFLKARVVCQEIEGAVAELKRHETFRDLGRLDRAKRLLQDAFEILGAGHAANIAQLDALARDRETNAFFQYLEEVTIPRLENDAPDAVGISITYRSQILPAVTLALLVKRAMPHVPVIFGGHIVSFWHDALAGCPEVFDWCDYLIAFEGESALDALLSALESGQPLDGVPNLAYRRDGRVIANPLFVEDINALPAPDYRGLPLDRYLAPEPVFLLNTSRGCYWAKCAFCSVSPSMRHRFRVRRPDLVLQDIAVLQQRHAAQCITFGDDCVPPRMLKALGRGLRGKKISWQCEVRFEPELTPALLSSLREAGCRNLIFGLESYSPRVLESMKKGVRHAEIRRILDDCRRAGIAFNLQLFFGFPGESEREARTTLEFVAGELHGAATASFGSFQLQRGSGVARDPEAFGIRLADGQNPLSVEIAYEPLPAHAAEARQTLREQVLERTRFRSMPLCIDAHTLLFLHYAGVGAMTERYYAGHPAAEVLAGAEVKLERRERQTVADVGERALLYDYDLDRAVELSGLARWVVERQLDRPRSASEVADELIAAAGDPSATPRLTDSVNEILGELLRRGMLVVSTEGSPM